MVVVQADDVTDAEIVAAANDLREQPLASGLMNNPVDVSVNPDRTVGVISLPMKGNGTDSTSVSGLETLRGDLIPRTLGELDGVETYVTGIPPARRTSTRRCAARHRSCSRSSSAWRSCC